MRLREIDKEKLYVAFVRGYSNNTAIYTEPIETSGQVQDVSGKISYQEYGNFEDYNLKVLFDYDDTTKYINSETRFWVRIEPTHNVDDFNYRASKVSTWDNGVLSCKLVAVAPNMDRLYTYDEDVGIYEFQCLYDEAKNEIKVPKNTYNTIKNSSKIWTKKPSSYTSTTNLLKIVDKKETQDYIIYMMVAYDD